MQLLDTSSREAHALLMACKRILDGRPKELDSWTVARGLEIILETKRVGKRSGDYLRESNEVQRRRMTSEALERCQPKSEAY